MLAGKAGDSSESLKSDKFNPWTKMKLQECSYEVKVMQKSTDFLVRIIVPVEGQRGGHSVVRVPALPSISA